MRFTTGKASMWTAAAAGIIAAACALPSGAARAQTPMVMKISLAALNDPLHQFAKDFAALIDKDSGGRIKTEIYPASQLGSIPRQIEGTQFGAIQCVITPPEFYSGIDERFEVMAAPGLAASLAHAQRLSGDPEVLKLMLSLGADKGLHGVAMFTSQPSSIIAKSAVRHLADLQGKKLRVFASQFQSVAFGRLGVTPVAMTLGDVLPALQQGAIDGSIAGIGPFVHLHFVDAAKYVTETNQPAIFLILEVSQKWYDTLPKDLQEIVDRAGAEVSTSINPAALKMYQEQRKAWTDAGGELISLPRDEQAEMMRMFSSVGDDVSKAKPAVREAFEIVADAAKRTRQAPSQ